MLANVERRAFKQAMFAVRDEDSAVDIVQDAMLKLAEHYSDRPAAELPMLVIVSQVSLDRRGRDGVAVSVTRAEGQKCDRCWRVLPELSREPAIAGLCARCVEALPAGHGGREVA